MLDQNNRSLCLVIGNGAIGTAIASRLHFLGFNPSFVGRKGPIYFKSRFEGWGKVTYLEIKPLSQADLSDVKIVFITVKSYDLAGALARYLPYIPKGIPIIPLCNGAIEDIIASTSKQFPRFKWRLGFCNFGVSQITHGIYSLKSTSGKAYWGPFDPLNPLVKENRTAIEMKILAADNCQFFQWSESIIPSVRRKWLYNTVMNTLCAARSLAKNGLLLNDMTMLRLVFDEAYQLGQELWGPWNEHYDKIFENLISLISSTADNENSMSRDVRLGQRTENEFLAKLAVGRKGYSLLCKLSEDISKIYEATPVRARKDQDA